MLGKWADHSRSILTRSLCSITSFRLHAYAQITFFSWLLGYQILLIILWFHWLLLVVSSAGSSPSPRTSSVEMPQGSFSPPSPSSLSSTHCLSGPLWIQALCLTTPKFTPPPRTSPSTPLPYHHFHLCVQPDVQTGTPQTKPSSPLSSWSSLSSLHGFSSCSGQKPQSLLNFSFFHQEIL